jgi:hypothetical protein
MDMQADIAQVDALMFPLHWQGQDYLTSAKLHADYVRNATEQGEHPKYQRHPHYLRVIRSIPNYLILIEQKDILIADKKALITSNNVLNQKLVSLLQPFFAANDGKRITFLNATAQMELTHHLDDLLNQEIAYRHSKLGAQAHESLVDGFLKRQGLRQYTSLYDNEIVKEFCRVWGVKEPKEDGSGQHWPGVGRLFKQFIYGIFPVEVRDAYEQRRGKYIHTVFRDDRRKDTLLERVKQIMPILGVCDDGHKEDFINLLERHDRRKGLEIQVTTTIRIRLSTIATNQMTLFDADAAD